MLRASVLVFIAALAAPAQSKWAVPSFPDLTIKIRVTRGLTHPMVTTWYFKGARQRNEFSPEASLHAEPTSASIMQCDVRTQIHLFEPSKTYTVMVQPAVDRYPSRVHRIPPKVPVGPAVTVTSNSVDTGERRAIGSYEARHIKTTLTIYPSRDAASKSGKVEIDGWYLDLPGLYCHENSSRLNAPPVTEWLMMVRGSIRDHMIFNVMGTSPRGLVVEETAKQEQDGNTIVNRTELIEVSTQSLDDSLFEVPPDYVPKEKPVGHTLHPMPDSTDAQP